MITNNYYYHKGGAYWFTPAPPLRFVPLTSINQQLAAIRTAMDTERMGRRGIKDALPDLSGCTIKGAGPSIYTSSASMRTHGLIPTSPSW